MDMFKVIEVNILIDSDLIVFFFELWELYLFGLIIIVFLYGVGKCLGMIILVCVEKFFNEDDLVLVEYSVIVVGM